MDQRQATADALPTIEEGYKYGKTNAAVVHVNEALAAVGALGTIAAAALYKKGEDDDRKNRLLFVILLYFRVPPAKPSAAGGTHRSWDEIHVHPRQCGTTSPITSRYPTLRILCPTSFNRVSVSFRESSFFLSGAPNRHFTIELTVSEIERI